MVGQLSWIWRYGEVLLVELSYVMKQSIHGRIYTFLFWEIPAYSSVKEKVIVRAVIVRSNHLYKIYKKRENITISEKW